MTAPETADRRIFIATGITGNVRVEWAMARWNQAAPVNWSKTEYLMWLDQFSPLGFLVAEARNVAVAEFLKQGFEWLIFIDHDVILPPTFLITVNQRIMTDKNPVWSGLYFTKAMPSEPLVFRGAGGSYYADWKMGDQVWCDGIPMGCAVIHKSILQVMWDEAEEYTFNGLTMRRVFETPVKMWEDAKTQSWQSITGTEDLHWCKRVVDNDVFRKAGWPAFAKKAHPFLCDTALFCRHIDPAGHQYPAHGEERAFARSPTRPARGAHPGGGKPRSR